MDLRVPELGEGIYEAELVEWRVKPGERVEHGQSLAEVLTDKASMELPSPFAGTITGLKAEPGQPIKVGDVLLSYSGAEGAEDEPAAERETGQQPAKLGQAVGQTVGQTVGGQQPEGPVQDERAEPRQRGADRQPDQPRAAPPRPADGEPQQRLAPPAPAPPAAAPPSATAAGVRAAPSVRYMARQLGVDLTQVTGSGPGGRILIADLAKRVQQAPAPPPSPAAPAGRERGQAGTRIKLQGVRRKIAEHMVQSKRTAPHYSYVDQCEVTELVRLREALKENFAQADVKLTYLAFVVKAVVAALKHVPLINASLDEQAGEIVLHDRYHIGIAVATPGGLVVPVIHDADQKDLVQLARDVERLSEQARSGKIRLEALRGGTFTITSIGGIGGLISTPIINYPEAAILGVGKIVKQPVYDDHDNLRPAHMLYLSLSLDHRVVDGALAAEFGNAIIGHLQNPACLLLPESL